MELKYQDWKDRFLIRSVIKELFERQPEDEIDAITKQKDSEKDGKSKWDIYIEILAEKLLPGDSLNILRSQEHEIAEGFFYNKVTRKFQNHTYKLGKKTDKEATQEHITSKKSYKTEEHKKSEV